MKHNFNISFLNQSRLNYFITYVYVDYCNNIFSSKLVPRFIILFKILLK